MFFICSGGEEREEEETDSDSEQHWDHWEDRELQASAIGRECVV